MYRISIVFLALFIALPASSQTLTTAGVCPGRLDIRARGLTPGGDYVVLKGDSLGEAELRGPCAGVASGLSSYRRFGPFTAEADGTDLLTPELGSSDTDWIQVVDLATCGTSLAVPLCWSGLGLAGSFAISDGPSWTEDPPTYSCIEACAEVFGGTAREWQCSTRSDAADRQAFVDGWGDDSFCTEPVAENYKLGDTYDCGAVGCSYSAYIRDHLCAERNHCWSTNASLACIPDVYESDDTIEDAAGFDVSPWELCRSFGIEGCEITHLDARSCATDDDHHRFLTTRGYFYEVVVSYDPADGEVTADLVTDDGSVRDWPWDVSPGEFRLSYGVHSEYYCDAYWDVYDCPSALTVRVSQVSDSGAAKGVDYDIRIIETEYF